MVQAAREVALGGAGCVEGGAFAKVWHWRRLTHRLRKHKGEKWENKHSLRAQVSQAKHFKYATADR